MIASLPLSEPRRPPRVSLAVSRGRSLSRLRRYRFYLYDEPRALRRRGADHCRSAGRWSVRSLSSLSAITRLVGRTGTGTTSSRGDALDRAGAHVWCPRLSHGLRFQRLEPGPAVAAHRSRSSPFWSSSSLRGGSRWSPLPRLLVLAGATQLLAALAFGIRTDESPTIEHRDRCSSAWHYSSSSGSLGVSAGRGGSSRAARRAVPRWARHGGGVGSSGGPAPALRRPALPPRPIPGRPNVLLIVLDTVRADHLSLYGYRRRTSPNLDALAADSLVFDRARANATYSLASHASLFTGLLPEQPRCAADPQELDGAASHAQLASAGFPPPQRRADPGRKT